MSAAEFIKFDLTDNVRPNYKSIILDLIDNNNFKSICDLGGGANPLLTRDEINSRGIEYTIIDISSDELDKAPSGYNKICADLSDDNLNIDVSFDLAFSNQLIEHVKNAEQFHKNIYSFLNPKGMVVHHFPTLYAPPFFLNVIIPESFGSFILKILQGKSRDNKGNLGKFPAYYSWCYGPTAAQIRRFESVGYKISGYTGLFGHSGYYDRIPVVKKFHLWFCNFLVKHPVSYLTSFSLLKLQKP